MINWKLIKSAIIAMVITPFAMLPYVSMLSVDQMSALAIVAPFWILWAVLTMAWYYKRSIAKSVKTRYKSAT